MQPFFATITAILIGLGLAASCGFRVFVPMLVLSIAVKSGLLSLAEGWHWIGTWPALAAFGVASAVEVAAFYVPYFANLLDTLAAPAAVVAGTVATAACVSEMDPLLQWSTALIAGGGIAGAVHASTMTARLASTVTTGGVGDFVVATVELAISFVLSVLAVVVPVLAGLVVCAILFLVVRMFARRRANRGVAAGA